MPMLPTRRSIRLRDFDEASARAYFFTVCVQDRRLVFGDTDDGNLKLWMEGQIAREVWDGLEDRFPSISTDAFVVLPNHVHGIVMLDDGTSDVSPKQEVGKRAGAKNRAPTSEIAGAKVTNGQGPTLGEVVRVFKAASTRQIRDVGDPGFAWQRNYYERVIRDERELERARAYIEANPGRWTEDAENPSVRG